MSHSRVEKTPTGYGVIKVDARKQITVPTVDVPTLAHTATTRFAALTLPAATAAAAPRVAPAQ